MDTGIGFAIPVNTAKALLPELVAKGKVTRGYLGVNIQDITDELAASLGYKGSRGALVSEVVQAGPADKGGVKRGDIIAAFDGKDVKDSHELAGIVAVTPGGKEGPVRIVREGKDRTLKVKVGVLKAQATEAERAEGNPQAAWGLELQDVTPEVARQMGLRQEQGVVVSGVRPGSPAEEASIQRGDIILEANRQPVESVDDMIGKITKSPDGDRLLLLLQRGQNTLYLVLKK
jgi:serine protease Do